MEFRLLKTFLFVGLLLLLSVAPSKAQLMVSDVSCEEITYLFNVAEREEKRYMELTVQCAEEFKDEQGLRCVIFYIVTDEWAKIKKKLDASRNFRMCPEI